MGEDNPVEAGSRYTTARDGLFRLASGVICQHGDEFDIVDTFEQGVYPVFVNVARDNAIH